VLAHELIDRLEVTQRGTRIILTELEAVGAESLGILERLIPGLGKGPGSDSIEEVTIGLASFSDREVGVRKNPGLGISDLLDGRVVEDLVVEKLRERDPLIGSLAEEFETVEVGRADFGPAVGPADFAVDAEAFGDEVGDIAEPVEEPGVVGELVGGFVIKRDGVHAHGEGGWIEGALIEDDQIVGIEVVDASDEIMDGGAEELLEGGTVGEGHDDEP
jgi:hypothetical protein